MPEFKNLSDYEAAAIQFHSGPPTAGVLEGWRARGDFVRFDPATGYFGIRTSSGIIRTFFRPGGSAADRAQYFYDEF